MVVLLMSCNWRIPSLPDSFVIEPQMLLLQYFGYVLLVRVLPLFDEVAQFLVQQPIEQFEILHTFLDIAASPEPTLSSADVVQHISILLL